MGPHIILSVQINRRVRRISAELSGAPRSCNECVQGCWQMGLKRVRGVGGVTLMAPFVWRLFFRCATHGKRGFLSPVHVCTTDSARFV